MVFLHQIDNFHKYREIPKKKGRRETHPDANNF
jgi:hypothetical protein